SIPHAARSHALREDLKLLSGGKSVDARPRGHPIFRIPSDWGRPLLILLKRTDNVAIGSALPIAGAPRSPTERESLGYTPTAWKAMVNRWERSTRRSVSSVMGEIQEGFGRLVRMGRVDLAVK